MKHLITGAGGFLGAQLARTLLSEDPSGEVVSLGIRGPADPKVQHVECDLLDYHRLADSIAQHKPDRVYHLAGSARVSQAIGMPEYYKSNFVTTQNLIHSLEGLGQPLRVFFSSSVHVYGNQTAEVDESASPAPNGFYGMSKYLCERAFEKLVERRPGVQVVVGRLYSCIGPGQAEGFVTSDLTKKLVQLPADGVLETGPLTARRRFLDVRDAARIIARLLTVDLPTPFEVVNIASPFEMQVRDVVDLLIKASGKKVTIHSTDTGANPFQGLRVNLQKLDRLVPAFPFHPIDRTLTDIWQWGAQNTKPR